MVSCMTRRREPLQYWNRRWIERLVKSSLCTEAGQPADLRGKHNVWPERTGTGILQHSINALLKREIVSRSGKSAPPTINREAGVTPAWHQRLVHWRTRSNS